MHGTQSFARYLVFIPKEDGMKFLSENGSVAHQEQTLGLILIIAFPKKEGGVGDRNKEGGREDRRRRKRGVR